MISLSKLKESAHFRKYLLTGKVFVIGFISLLLMIPGAMVKNMMRERQGRSQEAKEAIQEMWSDQQTLMGPLLEIPYFTSSKDYKGVRVKKTEYLYVLPSQLHMKSELIPEVRRRGIFETVLYVAKLDLEGKFTAKELIPKGVDPFDVQWSAAKLLVSVSDARGVKQAELIDEAESISFRTHDRTRLGNDLEHILSSPLEIDATGLANFEVKMELRGSESFGLIPVGENSEIEMLSSWHSPSFTGKFLPDVREISEEGFSSSWTVSGLSRGFPQSWTGKGVELKQSELGVRLMMPVGAYARSLRVVSYALLFVGFTFGAMFCAERMSGVAIHILQYAVAGVAIMLFYVLLLSLAEQAAFAIAYGTSALVILLMIVKYVSVIIRKKHLTMALSGMLLLMYGFFFVVLQCEDYALLMGSVGLVLIVGTVMYLTRDLHQTLPEKAE